MALKSRSLFIFSFKMKRFISQLVCFLTCILLGVLGVFYLADGSSDAFYVKLTTPKKTALVIGSSRAAQGLQPEIMNDILLGNDLYNFAFSRIHTPYGQPYLELIQKKLHPKAKGIFIVEVNPWSIAQSKADTFPDVPFKEVNAFTGIVNHVNQRPNFTYLLKCYEGSYIKILTNKNGNDHKDYLKVQEDGWFKVQLDEDFQQRQSRIESTLSHYKKLTNDYRPNNKLRIDYLKRTIIYLRTHGPVFLVRLPLTLEMLQIEDSFDKNFDANMNQIAKDLDVPYFNFSHHMLDVTFTDGHHLDIESGKRFSALLAQKIVASQ